MGSVDVASGGLGTLDTRKATRELGWSPLVDVETGVRRLWDWVAANPALFPRRDAAAA